MKPSKQTQELLAYGQSVSKVTAGKVERIPPKSFYKTSEPKKRRGGESRALLILPIVLAAVSAVGGLLYWAYRVSEVQGSWGYGAALVAGVVAIYLIAWGRG